jgi:hypothetical protein
LFWNNKVRNFFWNLGSCDEFNRERGGVMTTAEEYRRYAAQCLDLAARASNPNDKARLVQMAQAFLELADRRDVLDPQANQR